MTSATFCGDRQTLPSLHHPHICLRDNDPEDDQTEKVTENDVELAERYAAALNTIGEADGFTEVDVEQAERYAAALNTIENADEFTDADIERAERYAAALKSTDADE